jgi:hypothetical protein
MNKKSRILVLAVALAAALPSGSAVALPHTWSSADRYTDVSNDNRTFAYRTPSVQTGQKSAYELSARRNRGDDSKGRAEAAQKSRFEAVLADNLRVTFFGRSNESENDPLAKLRVYVHCVGEIESEWVLIGQKVVTPSTTDDLIQRAITVEDCESQTENGLMLQVLAGERGDRKLRTVFLQRAELKQGGAAVWTEDFTTP